MKRELLAGLGELKIIKMLAGALEIEELDDASRVDQDSSIYVSSDMMLQGTDLPENTHPIFWGMRFVAANVSDMAAMGCRPISMMLSLGLPGEMRVRDFKDLLEGIKWACRESGLKVVGGDTNASSELILSGFVTGLPFVHPFKRGGASPGEALYVTGQPGSAALGLRIIQSRPDDFFDSPDLLEEVMEGSAAPLGAFLVPEIRVKVAEDLASMGIVTSCIDVSDGISTDATHLATGSGVGIIIDESRLPFSPQSRGIAESMGLDPIDLALRGGDDYELLFTAPKEAAGPLRESDIAVLVGEVQDGEGVAVRRSSGELESLKSSGYQHFPGKGS